MRRNVQNILASGIKMFAAHTNGMGNMSVSGLSVNEIYACSNLPLRKNQAVGESRVNVLIVGSGSYIGTNLKWYLTAFCNYKVDVLDAVNLIPAACQFKGYDAVVFVAAIVHQKETKKNKCLYYKVNRDLAVRAARAAKEASVAHYIVMSSMSVYGMETGHITKDTKPSPKNSYGKSKLQADERIWMLRSDSFRVSVLRPPMVYGSGCRGNYQFLRKLARIVPVFPKTNNERSMIYIGNLCSFIKNVIDNRREGFFFPQNAEYVNTGRMAARIAAFYGKKMLETEILNALFQILPVKAVKKAFGSLTYEKTDTAGVFGFDESVVLTEWETE